MTLYERLFLPFFVYYTKKEMVTAITYSITKGFLSDRGASHCAVPTLNATCVLHRLLLKNVNIANIKKQLMKLY